MGPQKLTEADKAKILALYRQTSETTSTLAEQFGVSSSTISRFLKGMLSNQEYETLIHQKRLARNSKTDSQLALALETSATTEAIAQTAIQPEPPVIIPSQAVHSEGPSPETVTLAAQTVSANPNPVPILRSRKRRSSATMVADSGVTLSASPSASGESQALVADVSLPLEQPQSQPIEKLSPLEDPVPPPPSPRKAVADIDLSAIVKDLDDDLIDEDDLEEEDDDEDIEDDLDEVWEETDSEESSEAFLSLGDTEIRVLPFSEAILPPSCYLVTDRSAELVVRPLKEFAHLGKIPAEEVQQKTLPVFDNHRVARRFSNRFQKVIKIPDSRLLQKTLGHLRSKGITRIFLDGKVYQLGNN
ncbi:helix-turn-helix domain-containing protein [Synechocystis sp. LKSZ1]|uniref:helix-turn-helix domain-containing protein n=1 Tax=Synechocystis sp. LKSZ1 TaxID=3144951 RepID=UPI00336BF282